MPASAVSDARNRIHETQALRTYIKAMVEVGHVSVFASLAEGFIFDNLSISGGEYRRGVLDHKINIQSAFPACRFLPFRHRWTSWIEFPGLVASFEIFQNATFILSCTVGTDCRNRNHSVSSI